MFDDSFVDATYQKIAIVVEIAADALLRHNARQITVGYLVEAVLMPDIEGGHEVSRKALKQAAGSGIKAFALEGGRKRVKPWLLLARGDSPYHRTEDQHAGGVFSSAPAGQARRAPPTSPPSMRIASGQSKLISFSGGACIASASASAVNPA